MFIILSWIKQQDFDVVILYKKFQTLAFLPCVAIAGFVRAKGEMSRTRVRSIKTNPQKINQRLPSWLISFFFFIPLLIESANPNIFL